jgi:hypothetical protein
MSSRFVGFGSVALIHPTAYPSKAASAKIEAAIF